MFATRRYQIHPNTSKYCCFRLLERPVAKEKDYAKRKRDTNLEEKKRLHAMRIQSPKKRIIHKDRKTVTQTWKKEKRPSNIMKTKRRKNTFFNICKIGILSHRSKSNSLANDRKTCLKRFSYTRWQEVKI